MPSQFEWDEEKDRSNRAKHGIGFEEAKVIFFSPVLTAPPTRANPADFCPQGQLQGKAGAL